MRQCRSDLRHLRVTVTIPAPTLFPHHLFVTWQLVAVVGPIRDVAKFTKPGGVPIKVPYAPAGHMVWHSMATPVEEVREKMEGEVGGQTLGEFVTLAYGHTPCLNSPDL